MKKFYDLVNIICGLGIFLIIVFYFFNDTFEPEPKSEIKYTLNEEWLTGGPSAFFINNNTQCVTVGNDTYIFDVKSGGKLYSTYDEIANVINDKYIFFKSDNGIWDAGSQKFIKYTDSLKYYSDPPPFKVLTDKDGKIIKVVGLDERNAKGIYLNNYKNYINIVNQEIDTTLVDSLGTKIIADYDSVVVNIYSTLTDKVIYSLNLPYVTEGYKISQKDNITRIYKDVYSYSIPNIDHIIIDEKFNRISKFISSGYEMYSAALKYDKTVLLASNIFKNDGTELLSAVTFTEYKDIKEKYEVKESFPDYFCSMYKSMDESLFIGVIAESNEVGIYTKQTMEEYPNQIDEYYSYVTYGSIIGLIIFIGGILFASKESFINEAVGEYKKDVKVGKRKKGNSNFNNVENKEPTDDDFKRTALSQNTKVRLRIEAMQNIENADILVDIYNKSDNDKVKNAVWQRIPDLVPKVINKSVMNQKLLEAANENDNQTIVDSVRAGANIDTKNENGATPLFIASHKGNVEMVKFLLENGANPDIAIKLGATPLFVAVQGNGNLEIIDLLLKNKAEIHVRDHEGKTSLILAASENGNIDIAKKLVGRGAEINAYTEQGITALFFAAQNGFTDFAKLLIDEGANLDIAMERGATPLFIACQTGQTEMVKMLLDNGADRNIALDGTIKPIEIASQNGHDEIVELFGTIEEVAKDISESSEKENVKSYLQNMGQKCKDEGIYSIWSWVDSRENSTEYKFLYNVSDSNDFEFESPSYVTEATMLYEQGTMRPAGREIADGPDWMKKDQEKYDELHGGDLEEKLFEAIEEKDIDKIKELIEEGANPNAKNDWDTVLQAAAKIGNLDLVKFLVEKGSDINYKNPGEDFPLISLIAHDRNENTEEILRFLIMKGADPYATNARGITAIDIIKNHMRDFEL